MLFAFFSCKKETSQAGTKPNAQAAIFPTTEKAKQQVAIIKEVSTILKEVYQDQKAVYEVDATIYSGYYADERVLLKDLLFPEFSSIYQKEEFKKFKAPVGLFKSRFLTAFSKGNYPNLQKAFNLSGSSSLRTNAAPTDTTLEIFSNSNGVSIYFPYSENFGSKFSPEYFDNINADPQGPKATIVAADREADEAPGSQPYICGTRDNQSICFRNVTVNDAYAEMYATHTVGVGADIARTSQTNQTSNVYLVFIGEVRCTNQYDHLISLNNGGGSEIVFSRGDGYLSYSANGQINISQDAVPIYFKRKDIRKGNWKAVNEIWDSNWEVNNFNQVLGIYEEDTEGSTTIGGSLTTTVQVTPPSTTGGPGATATRTLNYSYTFQTKDPVIRQLNWNRESFYQYNRGTLANNCSTRNGWTVYDCNASVSYTMPEQ